MQIELIGCTSAGKSTLTSHIVQACQQQGLEILERDTFVLKQLRLSWLKGYLLRTILVDSLAFVACLLTWPRNHPFYHFASQLLFQLPIGLPEKLNLFRNVLKKIGICEIIAHRSKPPQIVLVDEGVLQIAHNLFVHSVVSAKSTDLATFTKLIPLPDAAIYLRQPEAVLIERTLKRGHKRIPDKSAKNVVSFIHQATATFTELVQYPTIEQRLLTIEGQEVEAVTGNPQQSQTITIILDFIRHNLSSYSSKMRHKARLASHEKDILC